VLTKKAVIFVAALLLSACGYHLRGAFELPANMKIFMWRADQGRYAKNSAKS